MSFLESIMKSTANAFDLVTKGYNKSDSGNDETENDDPLPKKENNSDDTAEKNIVPPSTEQPEDINLSDYKNNIGNMMNKPPFVPPRADIEEEEDDDKEKDEDFEQERERNEQQDDDDNDDEKNDDDEEDDEIAPDEDYEVEKGSDTPYSIDDSFTKDGLLIDDPFVNEKRPYSPWQ